MRALGFRIFQLPRASVSLFKYRDKEYVLWDPSCNVLLPVNTTLLPINAATRLDFYRAFSRQSARRRERTLAGGLATSRSPLPASAVLWFCDANEHYNQRKLSLPDPAVGENPELAPHSAQLAERPTGHGGWGTPRQRAKAQRHHRASLRNAVSFRPPHDAARSAPPPV